MNGRLPLVGPLERALHLRSFPELRSQSPQDLVLLAQLMREQWVRRGTVLQTAGRRVATVHLLLEGSVRCERGGRLRQRVEAAEAIGLLELLAGADSEVQYVADTNLLVLEADGAALIDILEEQFSVFSRLRHALGKQIVALRDELGVTDLEMTAGTAGGPSPAASFGFVERLIWVARSPVLAGFGVGVLADLVRSEPESRLQGGEVLWNAGSEARFLCLILDGTVEGADASGRELRFGAGSVIGVDAVFAGVPHGYTATAETSLLAIRIDAQALLDVAEDHFHVAAQMLAHSARTLLRLREGRTIESRGTPAGSRQASPPEARA
jgi:CRP-like cAMP-binding protein